MKYLKTYQEQITNNFKERIYITNIPVNDYILDIIMNHYDIESPLTAEGILLSCLDTKEIKIYFEIYIEQYIEQYVIEKYHQWDSMQYFDKIERMQHNAEKFDKTSIITIEEWLEKYHPELTLDEIIQSNKLGLI